MKCSPGFIMHRHFLNKFSVYHLNGPSIIQLYSQLQKGGLNVRGLNLIWQRIKGEKMPALVAYIERKHNQ